MRNFEFLRYRYKQFDSGRSFSNLNSVVSNAPVWESS